MRFIVKLLAVLFLTGWMTIPVQAQDSIIPFDDVEFTEITTDSNFSAGTNEYNDNKDQVNVHDPLTSDKPQEADKSSLWAIFIAGFIGGFAALLMPCIFPMLPLTVSFFTKGGNTKSKGIMQAVVYGCLLYLYMYYWAYW